MPRLDLPTEVIAPGDSKLLEELSTEVYEWLSLVRLRSPRVEAGDEIDPYFSRYQVPAATDEHRSQSDQQLQQAAKVCKITWKGFLPPSWPQTILIDTIMSIPSGTWFSLSATSFSSSKSIAGGNAECTFLRPPGSPGEYLMWEVRGHE